MTPGAIERSKREAMAARRRLDSTLVAVQQRLQPGNLAGEAWDGVKDKSSNLADTALEAVRRRPAAVSIALGAVALFLAREPIRRTVARFVAGDEEVDDGRVVTRIETEDPRLNVSSPMAGAPVSEGVN